MAETQVSASPVPQDPDFLSRVLQQIQRRLRKEQFETWFRGFELVRTDVKEAEFAVPTAFVRDWIQRNYMSSIQESVVEAGLPTGKVLLSVVATTADTDNSRVDGRAGRGVAGDGSRDGADRTDARGSGLGGSGLGGSGFGGSGSGRNQNRAGDVAAKVVGGLGSGSDSTKHHTDGHGTDGRSGHTQDKAGTKGPRGEAEAPTSAGSRPGRRSLSLNRNYTFEHFVVGPSNRLSHAAALAIGENPGCSYNPLFIHGNVGLGKTHLLQAVCHSIRRRNPSARVVYLTSEEFTNEFIHAIQHNSLENFRAYHREADVLVVDDIQFLASKDKTQEEFFHTFNSLYQHQKQIVLSSDRSPQDIPTLEERLVSRFKWGLVTEIEAPDFETRVAIVQRKARLRGQEKGLPDDVGYMIAERIANNIRELEGAVIKVLGMGSILGREVTVELAEEALRGVAKARHQHVTMDRIMEVVTDQFPVSSRDIIGKGRTQAISYPRQVAMHLARKHTDHSLEEIGKYFGNRDHTTVLYSVNKIEERITTDRMLRELLETLSGRLQR